MEVREKQDEQEKRTGRPKWWEIYRVSKSTKPVSKSGPITGTGQSVLSPMRAPTRTHPWWKS